MTTIRLKERTGAAECFEAAQVYPFTRWTPDLVNWIRVGAEPVREPGYSTFEVPTLDLPLAADRWILTWRGHPELSFEHLRAGQLPKLSAAELAERLEAVRAARQIREKLNISPLTTSTIIRQLRRGTEKG